MPSSEITNELLFRLIKTNKLLGALKAHAPRIHPAVEGAGWPLLIKLSDGPDRVSDLAAWIHSDASTVSRHVSALESHGLVERIPDPSDGRAHMIQVTAAGTELAEMAKEARGAWLRDLLADWQVEEVTSLITGLTKLNDTLSTHLESARKENA